MYVCQIHTFRFNLIEIERKARENPATKTEMSNILEMSKIHTRETAKEKRETNNLLFMKTSLKKGSK